MQKKAVEERELEPQQQQQQQQQQQKREKGAVEQAGWARLRRRGGTYNLQQHRATTPTQCRGRCTAGVAWQDPESTVSRRRPRVCVRWSGEGGSKQ
jgi:Tfp pilus assembly protein PilV